MKSALSAASTRSEGIAGNRRTVWGVCIFLAGAVFLVFGQTLWHGFFDYDDGQYVYANPHVMKGLTWADIGWAFTHFHCNNWHPVTWISHMLDCQLYGLNAGGHHLTNVLLHAANAILLFLVLRQMTRALWPSAFVGAIFALHPLRVESVAWISERKDVLSGLFFMLTLLMYAQYVQATAGGGQAEGRNSKILSSAQPVTFVRTGAVIFCLGSDEQAHVGNVAVRIAAARLLAVTAA